MNRKKFLATHWFIQSIKGGGSPVPGSGLIKELYQQEGNANSDIRVSIRPITNSQGAWSASQSYQIGEIRTFPTNSQLHWISISTTSQGESPYTHPEKWEICMGLDFIQNIGNGKFSRVSLQRNVDQWVREQDFSIGTISNSSWLDQTSNYRIKDTLFVPVSSSTSNSVPTTHPATRTWTVETDRTIQNSTTIGECNDSFALPTTRSQFLNLNLSSGLNLQAGDNVTLYGNSSNFFVFGIVNYNNATGESYGWCITFVGSGTFSSWEVKSEILAYFFQTGGETSRNISVLIQSYNSETGELIANSVGHQGSGSTSSWTGVLYKQPYQLLDTQGEFFNRTGQTTDAIGCWYIGEFTGTQLVTRHQQNTTGTGWRYIYLDGPDINNPPENVDIDTYGSLVTNSDRTVWSGLTEAYRGSDDVHKYIAISIISPSGSSTNTRAFIKASSNTANNAGIRHFVEFDLYTPDVSLAYVQSQSLGETVFIFSPTSSDTKVTWPYHGDISDNNTLKRFIVDNVEISQTQNPNANNYLRRYIPCNNARVLQEGTIIHPSYPEMGDFASYESEHYFDRYGFALKKLRMELLQNMYVEQWYPNLFAMVDSYIYPGKVVAQDGLEMTWPENNTLVPMSSDFKGQDNYAFISESNPDYICVLNFPDISNWRIGQPNRGNDHIENLSESSSKFRPYAVYEYDMPQGYVMDIQARIYLGNRGTL